MKDPARVRAIREDFRSARLSARERAILEYAEKLTTNPTRMTQRDVEGLRDAGLSDAEALDTCQIASYYNYVNRLADGLGVELEAYWARLPDP